VQGRIGDEATDASVSVRVDVIDDHALVVTQPGPETPGIDVTAHAGDIE
jgi:hypothetical protein